MTTTTNTKIVARREKKAKEVAERIAGARKWLAERPVVDLDACRDLVGAAIEFLDRGEDPGYPWNFSTGPAPIRAAAGALKDMELAREKAKKLAARREILTPWAYLPMVAAELAEPTQPEWAADAAIHEEKERIAEERTLAARREWLAAQSEETRTSEQGRRLGLALDAKIECLAIYRDLRWEAEMVGWSQEMEVDDANKSGSTDEARNPPLEALEALAAERGIEGVKLVSAKLYRRGYWLTRPYPAWAGKGTAYRRVA